MTDFRPGQETLAQAPHKLVSWYRDNQRSLPWRETKDAYRILVSETMLQQTRVETVIPYYHAFLTVFPTVRALAEATEEVVLKQWQGLGYYSRARNLHRAAQEIVSLHGGEIPADLRRFRELPGIGPYTAGAVMSIAFELPEPAVDGNVLRVMSRFLGLEAPIETKPVRQTITDEVAKWLRDTQPSMLTQSLMELGALICTPRKPQCETCPLQHECAAFRDGLVDVLPNRQKKKERKLVDVVAVWLEHEGRLLVERRPDSGLLAKMWQLPAVEAEHRDTTSGLTALVEEARAMLGIRNVDWKSDGAQDYVVLAEGKHIFTHIEWRVTVIRFVGYANLPGRVALEERQRWVPVAELDALAWPRVYERLLTELVPEVVPVPIEV